MEFIKEFCANNLLKDVMIQIDMLNNLLFRASDIGEVLDIVNIRPPISKYDETEKQMCQINTSTGTKTTIFFTKKGLTKFLFKKKTPLAEEILMLVVELTQKFYSNETQKLRIKCENSKNLLLQIEGEKSQINEDSNTIFIQELLYKIQNLEKTVQNLENSNIEILHKLNLQTA
jgi:peroxiredoxin family protein